MNEARRCAACGAVLRQNRLGDFCPACAWKGLSDFDVGEDAPAAPPVGALTPLLRLPGYELLEEIARGGMGIVYRARQLDPRRTVALKMLLPQQVGSPEMAERFRLEVRALTELEHPAILPVHHTGEHEGMPFFTMKLATGGTLAQRKAQLAGQWRAIAELMAILADAVQFAHERGVLHRDLKPGNILFDDQGWPYVSDFGLAKLISADHDLTRSVDFLGTPHYIAPEVAANSARSATIASDLYSLGAILYELLTGRPPFEADSVVALLKRIAEAEPVPPSKLFGSSLGDKSKIKNQKSKIETVPRNLEVICLKCLAKESARRYASARELAEDLRRWLEGREIRARPAGPMERAWLWARRHRATAAALGLALILLIALVIGLSLAAVRIAASRREALRSVEALEVQKANGLLAEGSTPEGIALLARRLRDSPNNWADCARLMWALQRRRWAVPLLAPYRPKGFLAPEQRTEVSFFRGADQRWLTAFAGTNLIVRDVERGTNLHEWPLPFTPRICVFYESDQIELTDAEQRLWTFQVLNGQIREGAMQPLSPLAKTNLIHIGLGERAFVVTPEHGSLLLDRQSGSAKTIIQGARAADMSQHVNWDSFDAGRKVVISNGERTVHVVDLRTGELSGSPLVASERVESVLVSPDERVVVTTSNDGPQFWDMQSRQELPGPREVAVHFVVGSFRPGGSKYIVAGNPFGLVIFDPLTGQRSKLPPRGDLLKGYCRPGETGAVVSVTFQRCSALFDAATGEPLCEPLAHIDTFAKGALKFIQDRFATRHADGWTVLWGVRTNRAGTLVLRHADSVISAHFSSGGQRVVTASYDGTAQVWDARTGQRIGPPLTHSKKVWDACFSPDGRRVATASWDASARIWDASSGAPLSPPLQATSYVFHVEFSPDGDRLLACGEDGIVQLYDGHTGRPMWALPPHGGHQGAIYWAHFSPDGRMLVTRPWDGNPVLWDARTGQKLRELTEPPGRRAPQGIITRGDFSRDGAWLALGSPEHYATIWQLPEGRLHAILDQTAVVRGAVFSPDAHTVLTVADDLTARLWDAQTGKARSPSLISHRRPGTRAEMGQALRAAAIHPDGHRVVTGGSDAALQLWDVRNGLSLGEPAEFGGEVMHAEFSPDGQRLLVACFDGTAHILPLPPLMDHAPAWLVPLAESLVGQRFDEDGATVIVSPTTLWEACETIRHASKDDPAVRWARDLLDL